MRRSENRPFLLSVASLAVGYLAGCCGGAFFAASVDTAALLAQPGMVSSDVSAAELISILCGYGAYGFGCLILSTTYVGFLLMPLVLAVKGFLSGCVFAAYLRAADITIKTDDLTAETIADRVFDLRFDN